MHPVQWEQVGGHSKKVVFLPSRLEPLFTPGLASSFLLDVVENSVLSHPSMLSLALEIQPSKG